GTTSLLAQGSPARRHAEAVDDLLHERPAPLDGDFEWAGRRLPATWTAQRKSFSLASRASLFSPGNTGVATERDMRSHTTTGAKHAYDVARQSEHRQRQ